jgi:hypothetical protein
VAVVVFMCVWWSSAASHSCALQSKSIFYPPQVVLAVNGGVLDLVLNFLCSVRRLGFGGHGFGGDVFRSLLAFAGDDEVERAMVWGSTKSSALSWLFRVSCV